MSVPGYAPHVKSLALVVLAACSSAQSPKLDGGTSEDARPDAFTMPNPDAPADAPGPYRRTIAVDGSDDFTAAEQFSTTSAAYTARVTWDDEHVYVGYGGPDVAAGALDAATKWLFVYVDTDPAATATGATQSQLYRTQRATFPAGFGAELYARWKADASFSSIERYTSGAWSADAATLETARAGELVELAIPRSALGGATTIGLVTFMINEKDNFEGSFAGLYAGNFTDGYAANLAITKYLLVDFSAERAPNDPANARP